MISSQIDAIKLITDPGIATEINDAFRFESEVVDFKLETRGMKYFIEIKIDNFTPQKVSRIFMSVVRFIQYQHCTFYQREVKGSHVIYTLISATEKMNGFYCTFDFS